MKFNYGSPLMFKHKGQLYIGRVKNVDIKTKHILMAIGDKTVRVTASNIYKHN